MGYNDLLLIPAGATNIKINEVFQVEKTDQLLSFLFSSIFIKDDIFTKFYGHIKI